MELTDLASFCRYTVLAYFKPDSGADAGIDIPFGNITAEKNPTNPKTVSANLNKRGNTVLAKRDTHMVEPLLELTSDQFADPTFPLQLMGDKIADLVQSSATASTFTFTAKAGRAYYVGKDNITVTSVAVAAAEKTPGTDYFVDDPNVSQPTTPAATTSFVSQNGYFILPVTAAGIADGASVVVTFNVPALTFNQYSQFSKLNRSGTLTVIREDTSGGAAREKLVCKVQLSVKQIGDNDPAKFRETVLECAVFGFPTVRRKP